MRFILLKFSADIHIKFVTPLSKVTKQTSAMADDDSWLYGEDNDEVEEQETGTEEVEAVKGEIDRLFELYFMLCVYPIAAVSQSNEDGVNNGEEEGSEGSDDDSDDDGIKVTIDKDKIEAAKSSYQNMQV